MKSKERAAYIFGGVCLAAILVVLFTKEQLSNDQRAIMRFLIALCSALLSYFFVGKLTLQLKGKGQAISAGSSFGVFVLLYTLVDPMNIKTSTATIAPAIVPKSETVARAQEVLREAGEYKGTADGIQDSQLNEAVSKWQKATNRKPTGVIEASDLPALREFLLKHGSSAISDPVIYRHHQVWINYDGPAGKRHGFSSPEWQPFTALKTDDGQSIDAESVSIVTVPQNHISNQTIELGDYAFLLNAKSKETACAQVGDIGPRQREGRLVFELSPHLANEIGVRSDYRSGGASPGTVVCLVFPGSGEKRVVPGDQLKSRTNRLFTAWGGLSRLEAEIAKE